MFFAPAGQCVIVSPSRDVQWGLHASARAGEAQDALLSYVYPYLTGITVTINAQLVSAFQVTFDAPYDEGIRMLSEDINGTSPFNVGNLIKARIGYADSNEWTPWYYGMLNQGGDGVTITPEGVSGTISAIMHTWGQDYVPENAAQAATTPRQLLEKIVTSMGWTLEVGPGAEEVFKRVQATRNDFAWQALTKTNMETIRRICTVWGLQCAPTFQADGKPDKLRVFSTAETDRGDAMAGKPRNTYTMRGKFSPSERMYPILTWGPEAGMAAWLGATVRASNSGVGVRAINKRTGNVVRVECSPRDVMQPLFPSAKNAKGYAEAIVAWENKRLDLGANPIGRFVGPGGGLLTPEVYAPPVPPAKDDGTAAADMEAQGVAKMGDGNQAQIATLSTLGVPSQEVFDVVNVRGLSPRYDGPYTVREVTHKWAANSYDMDLKVQRSGAYRPEDPAATATAGGQVPEK